MKNANVISILTTRPKPGKNDLEWHLGKKQASLLSRAFLLDTMAAALRVPRCDICLAFCPAQDKEYFENLIYLFQNEETDKTLIRKAEKIKLVALDGATTSQRLANLSRFIFEKNAKRALVICPDSPIIDPVVLRASLELLKTNNVVLGPTFDGAYYLIGAEKHYPAIFESVDWEMENTYRQTIDKISELNLTWQELEISYDVDRLEELEQLYWDIDNLRLTGKHDICRHTEKCLANLKR